MSNKKEAEDEGRYYLDVISDSFAILQLTHDLWVVMERMAVTKTIGGHKVDVARYRVVSKRMTLQDAVSKLDELRKDAK